MGIFDVFKPQKEEQRKRESYDPKLSVELFNQAVDMKRLGEYDKAIELQKKSIRVYPDDPDIMQNYYSMGKTFYLASEYDKAYLCYLVYCRLCVLRNPPIIRDYQAALSGDKAAKNVLLPSFQNLARHIGHATLDTREEKTHAKEISSYRNSLAGHGREQMSNEFANLVINSGFRVIFNDFDNFIKDKNKYKMEVFQLMKELIA